MGLLAGSVLDNNDDLAGLVDRGLFLVSEKDLWVERGMGCSDPSIHFSHNF